MNWNIEHIEPLQIVKVITEGDFNIEDHQKMIEDILSKDFWHPGMHTFLDYRKINFHKTTIPFMRKVSANYKKYEVQIGDGKFAFLMKSMADFARGRQFTLLTQPEVSAKLNIFLDERETIEWLTT